MLVEMVKYIPWRFLCVPQVLLTMVLRNNGVGGYATEMRTLFSCLQQIRVAEIILHVGGYQVSLAHRRDKGAIDNANPRQNGCGELPCPPSVICARRLVSE